MYDATPLFIHSISFSCAQNMLCIFFLFGYILQLLCVYVRHLKSHTYVNSLVYFRCFLLLNIAQNLIEYTIAPLQPIVFNFDSPTPPFVCHLHPCRLHLFHCLLHCVHAIVGLTRFCGYCECFRC